MSAWTLDRLLALPSVGYEDRRRSLPNSPGLYFVIHADSEVLYVGMARRSVRRRWKTWHQAVFEIKKQGLESDSRIAYLLYEDTDALASDEREAIRALLPTLNFTNVPGALTRLQKREALACRWIDCGEHDHREWPQQHPATEVRPCVCIVHNSCRDIDDA